MEKFFYTADDIMKILCIGKSSAYDIIKKLNAQLMDMGYHTYTGRVNKNFFDKCYIYREE